VSGSETIRAFVALELGPEMRRAVAELVDALRSRVSRARWVRPEIAHLTLRFLGSSSAEQIETLRPALAEAARSCGPTDASVAGLGTFPERGRPRVLWLGVALPGPILALQAACEDAAVAAGFPPEARPFHPHLTLARFRERVPRPDLPPADLGTARLETLVLFRSDLRPGGAVHSALDRLALGGAE
jgi:2'-5' RNA ligase